MLDLITVGPEFSRPTCHMQSTMRVARLLAQLYLKSDGDQWRRQDLVSGGTTIEAPKARASSAKGAEWSGVCGGVSAPQPTRGSGGAS